MLAAPWQGSFFCVMRVLPEIVYMYAMNKKNVASYTAKKREARE